MGERIRNFDWEAHPLGAPAQWPSALRMAMSLCLNSSFPTAIYWGPELHILYNDAWAEIPADKHPGILGMPAREGWSDIWDIVGPQFQHVFATGEGMALYEKMLPMVRGGRACETWWNYSLTAIRDGEHRIGGIFNQGNDVTATVLARRERQQEIERWRELLRQAPAPVALLRGPGHVFEFANDAYQALVAGREIVGKPVAEAIPEVRGQGFIELLDGVYRSGRPYLGTGVKVNLRRAHEAEAQERVLDFIYQPMRNAAGEVDGVFVLANDVTERARAESALRVTNWQLGEERARLAALIEAEQRAQQALHRLNETLEAHVKSRTAQLTQALAAQQAVADRLRATFATDLIFQGFVDPQGTVLDANPVSLAAIGKPLAEVVGKPLWDTDWFSGTPGMGARMREAVQVAVGGETVRSELQLNLPGSVRRFLFSLRPVFNAKNEVVGLVPEALEIPDAAQKLAA